MNDIQNIDEKKIVDGIELMENSDKTGEKPWEALDDEEAKAACRDLLGIRLALHEQEAETLIDVDRELQRLKARQRQRRIRRAVVISCGIAAAVVGVLFLLWNKSFETVSSSETVVYEARENAAVDIVLALGDNETIVLDKKNIDSDEPEATSTLDYTAQNAPLTSSLSASNVVQRHTITIPYGRTFKLVLCDSTIVWLNANSKLVYPATFDDDVREVFLEGEAYFDVAHNAKPFVVKTDFLQTTVLGTEFNIRSDEDGKAHVTLISGVVRVSDKSNTRHAILSPGEDATFLSDGQIERKFIDTDLYTYWKDGYFYFDQEPLKEIMQTIGKWYNVNVVFRNSAAMDYKVHFISKRDEAISHTISLMNRLKKMRLTLVGNTLYIE